MERLKDNENKIFSIVVTYNGVFWILKCLSSLVNSGVKNHHIIVIDNQSQDDTVSVIKREFPSVQLLEPGENLGFGKANNLGMQLAMENYADFVFLLNQDAWVNKKMFQELLECSSNHPEFGILSPLQLDATGNFDNQFSMYYKPTVSNSDVVEIDFVNASGWLVTASCFNRVGGFSPLFFHYGEDADYCNRVKYHGFKIGVAKNCSYVHDRGGRVKVTVSLDKQIQQMFVTYLVRIANVNRPLMKNIAINLWRLTQKWLGANNGNVYSAKGSLKAFNRSLGMVKQVREFRKLAKEPCAFLKS